MGDIVLHVYKFSCSLVLTSASCTFSLYCLRLFVVVYKLVMLLLMDCVCILTFIVVTLLLHTQIALHYNVWSEAIFQCETESKGLTNYLL